MSSWYVFSVLCLAGLYDAEQILMLSTAHLAHDLSVSEAHAKQIRHVVERAIAPPQPSLWDMLHADTLRIPGTPNQDDVSPEVLSPVARSISSAPLVPQSVTSDFVSSGNATLDQCMGGGFAKGMVSELVGESASGKTQLVLYAAVCTALGCSTGMAPAPFSVLYGGCGHAVALITTHGRSAARHMVRRMVDMANNMLRAWYAQQSYPTEDMDAHVDNAVKKMLANIYVACALKFEAMEHALCYTLPGLMARMRTTTDMPLSLIVVDSIPPLFQEDAVDPDEDMAKHHSVRAARLHALGQWLKRLAAGTVWGSPAVVVTNHVKDAFASDTAFVRHALAQGQLPLAVSDSAPCRGPLAEAPPVPIGLQAAHFQGLLACIPCVATAVTQLPVPKMAQLGLVWSNCINARYLLAVMPAPHGMSLTAAPRRLRTVFAPTGPSATAEALFLLTSAGIHVQAP